MSAPDSLKHVPLDEMKDLWSANDQMARALRTFGERASDPELKQMLQDSGDGIGRHTDILKELIQANGGAVSPEHGKGMERLVAEALIHAGEEAPEDGLLRDIQIIAQYQRMSHDGLAGFGSAAAYARALGRSDQEATLKGAVSAIDRVDADASHLAESVERAAA